MDRIPLTAQSPALHRSPGVAWVEINGSTVIYVPAREEAHLLNPSATAIWRMVDGHRPVHSMLEELADHFGVPIPNLEADVVEALDRLVANGALSTERSAAGTPPPGQTTAGPESRLKGNAGATYDALGWQFGISCPPHPVGAFLEHCLQGLLSDGAPSHCYSVDPEAACLSFSETSEMLCSDATAGELIGQLLWHMNSTAIRSCTDALLVHASAVETARGACIFPAVSNSGKSTIATILTRGGFPYLTDEAVAIDPQTLQVLAYPKPIGLDPGSFHLFPDLEPRFPGLDPAEFSAKWWLSPQDAGGSTPLVKVRSRHELGAIVFPSYVSDGLGSLERLSEEDVVLHLLRNAFNMPRWGQTGLDALAQIASRVPAYRIAHNDADKTLSVVTEITGGPPHR